MINLINLMNAFLGNLCPIKKYGAIQNDMFGLCPIQKNGAIQKDLVADNEWSPYKCRHDIFVVWAPFSSLLLTCLFCGRHITEKEQINLLPSCAGGIFNP
jgi:hypothetical protein